MQITRENYRRWAMRFWLAEPHIDPCPDGYVCLSPHRPSFPDLATLTPSERRLLIPVIARHPEYLHEIRVSGRMIQ